MAGTDEGQMFKVGAVIGLTCATALIVITLLHCRKAVSYTHLDVYKRQGYVDAVAAHEESIVQYMKDYDASFRILDEPLMITGIGVAFAKNDDRGICEQMEQTLEEMRQDGTTLKIVGKYLDDPEKYLEVDALGY